MLIALEESEWLDISIWDQPPADGPIRPPEPPIDFIDRIEDRDTEILGQESGRLACGELADELGPESPSAQISQRRCSRSTQFPSPQERL
jgi:hypothetical protein